MNFVAHMVEHLEFDLLDAKLLIHPMELTRTFAESADRIIFASDDENVLILADFLDFFATRDGLETSKEFFPESTSGLGAAIWVGDIFLNVLFVVREPIFWGFGVLDGFAISISSHAGEHFVWLIEIAFVHEHGSEQETKDGF